MIQIKHLGDGHVHVSSGLPLDGRKLFAGEWAGHEVYDLLHWLYGQMLATEGGEARLWRQDFCWLQEFLYRNDPQKRGDL